MSRHLIDLLKEVRPKRAVFTTFTLNVPFFDATIFPAVSAGDGCEVSVLVDARQFGIAAQGAFSRDAGMQYTIAPIRAPGHGIFHPKLAFIETADDQILTVGSGNLTPAGWCTQLESWDVCRRSEHPHLFAELSAFFSELGLRVRETSPRASDVLAKAARRANVSATSTIEPRRIRLVHTLAACAADQFVEAVTEQGHRAQSLTVLSPFHSAGGAAVRTLAAALDVRRVQIGHDGCAGFHQDWYSALVGEEGFVVPQMDTARTIEGRLHAKVYQVETAGGVLTMSGSVNATTRSLHGTRNIEVAIARWEVSSAFRWTPQQPTAFDPAEFPEGNETGLLVEAAIEQDAFVNGIVSLSGRDEEICQLRWQVFKAEQQLAEGETYLDRRGRFRFELSADRGTDRVSLTLLVRVGQLVGYAWLNDEEALYDARLSKRLDPRLRRAANGSADVDSVLYLRQLINGAMGKLPTAKKKSKKEGAVTDKSPRPDPDEADAPFSYEEWLNSGARRGQRGAAWSSAPKLLQAVYALLFPKAEAARDTTTDGPHRGALLGMTDEEEEQELGRMAATGKRPKMKRDKQPQADTQRIFEDEIRAACTEIHTAFDASSTQIVDPLTLALIASAVELRKFVHNWNAWTSTAAPLSPLSWDFQYGSVLWLERMCRYPFQEEDRHQILPVAVALASLAAYQFPSGGRAYEPRLEKLPTLKSFLRRLAVRELLPPEAEALAAAGFRDPMFRIVDRHARERADMAIAALNRSPYLDDALLNVVRATLQGAADQEALTASYPAIPASRRSPKATAAAIAVVQPREVEHGCAICNITFTPQERDELKFQRAISHRNRGGDTAHLLLYPEDHRRFKAALEELING
jgi:hypothetical protein